LASSFTGGDSSVLYAFLHQLVASSPARFRQVLEDMLGIARSFALLAKNNPKQAETSVQAMFFILQNFLALVCFCPNDHMLMQNILMSNCLSTIILIIILI
jgi:hypothetical protein